MSVFTVVQEVEMSDIFITFTGGDEIEKFMI